MSHAFTDTFGALFISFALDGILYGTGLVLAMQYFVRFPKDAWSLKLLVAVMVFLATVHYGSLFGMVYWLIIVSFGNEVQMNVMPRTALSQLLAIYFLAFSSQCFFASRIWKISDRNFWYVGWVMLLALLQLSAGLAQTVSAGLVGFWSLLGSTEKITTIQSAATAVCDFSITAILCYVLHGNRTGIKKTDTLVDKLIIYAINRGALTTLAAFLNMLLFVLRPSQFIFMIPLLPSGHLYVISVVTTLTMRTSLREDLVKQPTGLTMPLTTLGFAHGPETPPSHPSIQVGTDLQGTKSVVTSFLVNETGLHSDESTAWDHKANNSEV